MWAAISQLFETLRTSPVSFFIQLWETMEGWLKSRRWKLIFLVLLPLVLLSGLAGIVLKGYMRSKQELTTWYAGQFQNVVDKEKDSKDPSKVAVSNFGSIGAQHANEKMGMDLAEITSRRLIALQPGNEKARFYVAQGMERRGLKPHARVMINNLAPEDRLGYAPAHAWVVQDLIQSAQEKQLPLPQKALKHHLQSASQDIEAEPQLLILYAALLDGDRKVDEALNLLQRAANKDGKHWVDVAKFSRRIGKLDVSTLAAKNALAYHQRILDDAKDSTSFEELEVMRVQLAVSYALLNEHTKAIETLMLGLKSDQPCNVLRQALSNAHLYRYQSELERVKDPSKIGLDDVEKAMFWNPSNPAVADLVSQLMAFQKDQKEQIGAMLRKQISRGEGVALTHVLLANEAIIDEKIDDAIPHLEIAYRHFPTALNVLNNLSLALATTSKPDLKRAEELIEQAVKLGGESTELMDTRGQILAIAGKDLDAIRSFEKSIALMPSRIRTRERLIELYEKVGLKEMVPAQLAAIEDIKKQILEAEERRRAAEERDRLARENARQKPMAPFCIRPDEGVPPSPALNP
jgi:tetratricopeptide (TPR) repeat protein